MSFRAKKNLNDYGWSVVNDENETVANDLTEQDAKEFAAAHEMLEALKAVHTCRFCILCQTCRNKVKAAIIKSGGTLS